MIRAMLEDIPPDLLGALKQADTLSNLQKLFDDALSGWLRERGMADGQYKLVAFRLNYAEMRKKLGNYVAQGIMVEYKFHETPPALPVNMSIGTGTMGLSLPREP